ncbi:hypothetical protein OXX80_009060 [Metschnikowia pulcherrima]
MSDPLDSIRKSCEGISNTKFKRPGIFTNAMLTRPELTTLIRDALPAEKGLYRITKSSGISNSMARGRRKSHVSGMIEDDAFVELKPERIDGKSIFVDRVGPLTRLAAVNVPLLSPTKSPELANFSETSSSPTRRKALSQYKSIPRHLVESEDVNAVCDTIEGIIDRHPGLAGESALRNKVIGQREEYSKLLHDIGLLERTVSEQRQHLERHHENLIEVSPTKGHFSPTKSLTVEELIEREEERIRQLEKELAESS